MQPAPTETSVSLMVGLPGWEATRAFADYAEGDVGIARDSDTTRGLSTHLPDSFLWKPIFVDGEIIAFGFNFIHSPDVGGRVPGSISPSSTDIFQEGLRIPPLKLMKAGVLNQDVLDLILLNCRIPEQNWGDIKAQLAPLTIAERRVQDMAARYGIVAVKQGIVDLLDSAEARARRLIHTQDPETGKPRITVAQPLSGGSGGRPLQDGIDGTSFTGGWLRNVPNDVLEAEMPVLVENYGYRTDAAAPGTHRGGTAIVFRLRNLVPRPCRDRARPGTLPHPGLGAEWRRAGAEYHRYPQPRHAKGAIPRAVRSAAAGSRRSG